jgi:pseudouridine synthase, RluA family
MTDTLYVETSEYEEREAVFDDEDAGKRLDSALAERFPDLSRSRIQSLIENGLVEPSTFTKNSRIKSGDRIVITVNERKPLSAEPEAIDINVVYEDDDILVVDKARGMVVHPAKGNTSGTLVNALLAWNPLGAGDLSALNGQIRPGIVHRIDKNTSGLLVVAKNDIAHTSLADQFAAHSIKRKYTGIVIGGLKEENGIINKPIGRDPKNRLKNAVVLGGKHAVTHWEVLEHISGRQGVFTLLDIELETGRTHQIRVHMASIGHPILGDDLYGPSRGLAANEGQYLHAGILGFEHPTTGKSICFESPLPQYFETMLKKIQ